MNYQKVYDQIIQRSKSRGLDKKKLEGYFEKHHIIPKCMGGLNQNDNYALLTAREHYLAHWLLWKTDKSNHKLLLAYDYITRPNKKFQSRTKITARQYSFIKESYSLVNFSDEHRKKMCLAKIGKPSLRKGFTMSEDQKNKLRKTNLGKTYSIETKLKHSLAMTGFKHSEEIKQSMRHPKSEETKTKMKLASLEREKIKREKRLQTL